METFKRIRRWYEGWNTGPLKHVSRLLYWLRTHTYHRYHMLNLKNKKNGYSWGWLDRSEGILFANMAILVDFVEKEMAFEGHVDWRSAAEVKESGETENDPWGDANRDAHALAKKEMIEIYDWWTKGRKEEHDAWDRAYDDVYTGTTTRFEPSKTFPGNFDMVTEKSPGREAVEALWKRDEALENKDEEMIIRLVKVSGYMWT
jgi:hypothetical protein